MFLVGQAEGAFLFGAAAHGLGYPVMWAGLTARLLAGGVVSLRLPVGDPDRPRYTGRVS